MSILAIIEISCETFAVTYFSFIVIGLALSSTEVLSTLLVPRFLRLTILSDGFDDDYLIGLNLGF